MGDREDELARAYDAARPRLIRVAYAALGSFSAAEDAVSDTWLKLVYVDSRERVLDHVAWSTVVLARAVLDMRRSTRMRREMYVGPWLPEPIVARMPSGTNPADRILSSSRHVTAVGRSRRHGDRSSVRTRSLDTRTALWRAWPRLPRSVAALSVSTSCGRRATSSHLRQETTSDESD